MILVLFLLICSFVTMVIFRRAHDVLELPNKILGYFTTNQSQIFFSSNMLWCEKLRENYKIIEQEYLDYCKSHALKRISEIDEGQLFLDKDKEKWHIVAMLLYGQQTSEVQNFPKTWKLVKKIPGLKSAMFSVLEPGKIIPSHRGIYEGCLRYHLGIRIPRDDSKCFIQIENFKYHWRLGEDIMFDDNFVHFAQNLSSETRVILFLDIEKKYENFFAQCLNKIVWKIIYFSSTLKKVVANQNKKKAK